uniref:YHYH domain-containing protein n=1 Tax=Lotharella globosa TaxID=91324 RepID=A0A7S3YUK3_9EUKA
MATLRRLGVFCLLHTILGCGLCGSSGSSVAPEDCPLSNGPAWTMICSTETTPSASNNYCMHSNANTFTSDDKLNVVVNGCPDHVNNKGVLSARTSEKVVEIDVIIPTRYSPISSSATEEALLKSNLTQALMNTSINATVEIVTLSSYSNETQVKATVDVHFSGYAYMTHATSFVNSLPMLLPLSIYGVANATKESTSCWGSLQDHLCATSTCCSSSCGSCSSTCGSCGSSSCGSCGSSGSCCSSCGSSVGSSCGSCSSYSSCGSSNSSSCGSSSGSCGSSTCGGTCGSTCNTCGGCSSHCGTCSSSSGSCGSCGLAAYAPAYHDIWVKIPLSPQISLNPTSVSGHEPVGIAINGVLIDSAKTLTRVFDSCMGHVDGDHKYHYHLPPTCLFTSLGIVTPSNASYWLDEQPNRYGDYWNATSDPSPIVGYALDGFPIQGPYDENGTLMLGTDHEDSSLDDCNGKTTTSGYRYFWTPTPPFVPSCLRGTKGELSAQMMSIACAYNGFTNTYVLNQSQLDVNLEANGLSLFSGSCSTDGDRWSFLFRIQPPMNDAKWTAFAYLFGVLMVLQTALVIYYLSIGRQVFWKSLGSGLVCTATVSRAIFYLVDPFYTRRLMSPTAVGVLYGLQYPSVNAAVALILLNLLEVLATVRETQKRIKAAEKLKQFLPRTRWAFSVFTVSEYATQIMADALRGNGYEYNWLFICQVYFASYGLLLGMGYARFKWELQQKSLDKVRHKLDMLERISLYVAIAATTTSLMAVVYISVGSMLQADDWAYFAFEFFLQSIFCFNVFVLSMALAPAEARKQRNSGQHSSPEGRPGSNGSPFKSKSDYVSKMQGSYTQRRRNGSMFRASRVNDRSASPAPAETKEGMPNVCPAQAITNPYSLSLF